MSSPDDTHITTGCYTNSRCIFIHCTLIIPLLSGYSWCCHPTIVRVLIVLPSHYHHGTHCVILSSGYSLLSSHYHQCNHCVTIPLSSRYSLCYHRGTHCVIILLSSGYSLCFHPPTISVLNVLPSHYNYGTHCVIILLSSV